MIPCFGVLLVGVSRVILAEKHVVVPYLQPAPPWESFTSAAKFVSEDSPSEPIQVSVMA